ncbi:MAG: Hsp33 family molecular chaperone HslO, partial [Sphaerochaetaceae bacterium]|nr:Hsp33 family molecular chaperone HslO [Sphaerochaetaceae bacterium]
VMLQKGNLAEDLRIYFKESEQTLSLFVLDFDVDEDNRIIGVGGIFFQLLPGDDEEEIMEELEKKIKGLPSLAKYISAGNDPKKFIEENFEGANHLSHSLVGFSCPCDKKNFAIHLKSLPQKDKEDIKKNGPFPLELVCLNCNSKYEFTKDELQDLLK